MAISPVSIADSKGAIKKKTHSVGSIASSHHQKAPERGDHSIKIGFRFIPFLNDVGFVFGGSASIDGSHTTNEARLAGS